MADRSAASGQSAAPQPGGASAGDALSLADRVLALAADVCRGAGAAGAQVQAVVDVGEESLTRFAASAIHQNVTEETRSVRVVVSLDGRTASVGGTQTSDDDLRRLATAALDAARLLPSDPEWPGLAPPAEDGVLGPPEASAATAQQRADAVAAFVAGAGGLVTAGFCSSSASARAYASTTGRRVAATRTAASVDGIARAPLAGRFADGSGRASGTDLAALDAAAAGARAGRTARAAAHEADDVEPGVWPVVLQPGAMVDVLALLSFYGFTGRAVHEGRSFVRLGEQQLDPAVTLSCDPADPRIPALPFDDEGSPAAGFDLVRGGVSTAVAHDRRSARAAGAATTGSAMGGGFFSGGIAGSLRLEPGTGTVDDLVAGVERGLLVTDFWYTRVLDPRTLVLTGLTRNGLFVIEDGEVVCPAPNVRFTQSYAQALAPGAVRGVGGESALMLDAPFSVLTPSVSLAGWNVTGNSSG